MANVMPNVNDCLVFQCACERFSRASVALCPVSVFELNMIAHIEREREEGKEDRPTKPN